MVRDYPTITWDEDLQDDCRQLIQLAIREDLENQVDWTTVALVDDEARATAQIRSRAAGILAGLGTVDLILEVTRADVEFSPQAADGGRLAPGQTVGTLHGNARDLLTLERTLLNFLGHLSGIATLTARFLEQVEGTGVPVYDTRKTTPGWRRLEKYAVQVAGGHNHRVGLYAGVMIKDNHLAFWSAQQATLPAAVQEVQKLLASAAVVGPDGEPLLVEVEVDSMDQLRAVLPAAPDIVLLDNMSLEDLREAVVLRDQQRAEVQLEASGGVHLQTIRAIAETGVDRISVGALTHSAVNHDLGLDWE